MVFQNFLKMGKDVGQGLSFSVLKDELRVLIRKSKEA